MSELEKQAKTGTEIYLSLESKELNNNNITAEVNKTIQLRSQKWVPLEAAQKEIAEASRLVDVHLGWLEYCAKSALEWQKKAAIYHDQLEKANRELSQQIANAMTMNSLIKHKDICFTKRAKRWVCEIDLQTLQKLLLTQEQKPETEANPICKRLVKPVNKSA